MTRTSFAAASKAYLDAMRPYYRPSTLEWWRRNLNTIRRDPKALIGFGQIGTNTPSGFLEWCGNPIVSVMRRRKHVRFPHGPTKPVRMLDADELARIATVIEGMDGWPGSVARFLVGFPPFTGLRPKEIRLARVRDLDLAKDRMLVAHPKGEGAWASPDFAPVPQAARPALDDLLAARTAYLDVAECEWLIPYRRVSGEIGPWSDAMLRKLKGEIARASGVTFSLKTFRATLAQTLSDRGVPIEKVSRAFRHSSTETTEAFYARIRASDAFRDYLERVRSARGPHERPPKVCREPPKCIGPMGRTLVPLSVHIFLRAARPRLRHVRAELLLGSRAQRIYRAGVR